MGDGDRGGRQLDPRLEALFAEALRSVEARLGDADRADPGTPEDGDAHEGTGEEEVFEILLDDGPGPTPPADARPDDEEDVLFLGPGLPEDEESTSDAPAPGVRTGPEVEAVLEEAERVRQDLAREVEHLGRALEEARREIREARDDAELASRRLTRRERRIRRLEQENGALKDALVQRDRQIHELRTALRSLRAAAERQRERQQEELHLARRAATEELLRSLLPALDHLRLALDHVSGAPSDDPLAAGLAMTAQGIEGALRQLGLRIVAVREGEPFDPRRHEAIARRFDATVETDRVGACHGPAYLLEGRLLRAARVTVHSPPPPERDETPVPPGPVGAAAGGEGEE